MNAQRRGTSPAGQGIIVDFFDPFGTKSAAADRAVVPANGSRVGVSEHRGALLVGIARINAPLENTQLRITLVEPNLCLAPRPANTIGLAAKSTPPVTKPTRAKWLRNGIQN